MEGLRALVVLRWGWDCGGGRGPACPVPGKDGGEGEGEVGEGGGLVQVIEDGVFEFREEGARAGTEPGLGEGGVVVFVEVDGVVDEALEDGAEFGH